MPPPSKLTAAERLEHIKELAIIGMFSDDEMMEILVLKGGNALDLIYRNSTRASVDVDFSMADDFPGGAEGFRGKAEGALTRTYRDAGYLAFDFQHEDKPARISDDVKDFWGGYLISFKLLTVEDARRLPDLEERRRHAINLGKGTRFEIELSRFEFVEGKLARELHGYQVFVYSEAMIVAEKLRALCQQMPEYAPIIHRARPGTSRARDFVDIHLLVTQCGVDITSPEHRKLLAQVFKAKHVPLAFLGQLATHRGFHAASFDAIRDTVKPGVVLKPFDVYFDFVLDIIQRLEAAGDV